MSIRRHIKQFGLELVMGCDIALSELSSLTRSSLRLVLRGEGRYTGGV